MRFSNEYGSCEISDLPGCDQIAVSHSAFILPELRHKGYGSYNHLARLHRMHDMHYDLALCTTRADNLPQIRILAKNGWKRLYSFNSKKTGSHVILWVRDLSSYKSIDTKATQKTRKSLEKIP